VVRNQGDGWNVVFTTPGWGPGWLTSDGAGEIQLTMGDGAVHVGDGEQWQQVRDGISLGGIYDLWAAPDEPGTVFALRQTDLLRIDGAVTLEVDLSQLTLNGSGTLSSMFGFSSTDIWLGGIKGVVVHYDGDDVVEVPMGIDEYVTAFWGTAPDELFAVTSYGTVLTWDQSEWSVAEDFWGVGRDICGFGADDIWLTGHDEIHHHDGTAWDHVLSTPAFAPSLYAGVCAADGSLYVVGEGGYVARLDCE
jgi:hypothetical protein